MIAEALQPVGQILRPPALEVSADRLRQRHAHIGAGHQVVVKGLDRRQTDQETVRPLGPFPENPKSVFESPARMQPRQHDLRARQQPLQQGIHGRVICQPPHVRRLQAGKALRKQFTRPLQRQQIGVRLAEKKDTLPARLRRWRGNLRALTRRSLPTETVEQMGLQDRRRRCFEVLQQALDVIKDRHHNRSVVYRVKPVWAPVHHQHHNVRQHTRAEATALIQMHTVTQTPSGPLGVIEVLVHLCEAPLLPPATAAGRTHKQHAAQKAGVDHPPVQPLNHIPFANLSHARTPSNLRRFFSTRVQ